MESTKFCNVCKENKDSNEIAYCSICLESGQVCYECLKKINNPKKCIICKKEDNMKNLPIILSIVEKNLARIIPIEIIANVPTLERSKKNKIICIMFLFFLILSWMFSAFSYFMIFRLKPKNYLKKPYIPLGCGAIFGLPITLYVFRNFIRNNIIIR